MKVIHVRGEHILGAEVFEVEPGKVTVFEAENGEGKSTRIQAIEAVFGRTGLGQIKSIYAGDESAKIVLTLEDDEGRRVVAERNERGVKVQRQIKDSKVGLTAGFEAVKRPAEYLSGLIPQGAILNPIRFLNANDRDRVDMFLDALPITFDADEFWATIGMDATEFRSAPAHKGALFQIDHYKGLIFSRRTDINRDEKNKRGAAEQKRRKLPMEIPTVDGLLAKQNELADLKAQQAILSERANAKAVADEKEIRGGLAAEELLATEEEKSFKEAAEAEAEQRISVKQKEIDDWLHEKRSAAQSEIGNLEKQIAKLQHKIEVDESGAHTIMNFHTGQVNREAWQRISVKQEEIATQLHDRRNEVTAKIGNVHVKKQDTLDKAAQLQPQIEAVLGELGELEEQIKNAERIKAGHEEAIQFETEAGQLKADAERHTKALQAIDSYKAGLIENLPIQGVDIADGVLTVDRVPWKTVNTSRKFGIAVAVICLRFGDAKFKPVFIDNAESLDSKSLAILEQELIRHGAQAFIARVADVDEMTIRKVE